MSVQNVRGALNVELRLRPFGALIFRSSPTWLRRSVFTASAQRAISG